MLHYYDDKPEVGPVTQKLCDITKRMLKEMSTMQLPDSPRLTNELRDKLIASQSKCDITACPNTRLTYYNKETCAMYCKSCALKINGWNGPICIPYTITERNI